LTLSRGASGNLTVRLTPMSGSFDQPVAFSCSGLPSQARCLFSPGTVTPGSQESVTTLTISTASSSARHWLGGGPLYAVWLAGFGLMGTVLTGPRSRRNRRVYFVFAFLLALTMLQLGCGTTGSNNAAPVQTQPGTYSVVITGTSAGQQYSTTATVTVQ
jgi:hypothetical protein